MCVSFRLDAAIMFESPEAASCRLTLTNTAQKLRLGGCKLFSSSQEKHSQTACRGGGGSMGCNTLSHPLPATAVPGPPTTTTATLPASSGGGAGHGGPCIGAVPKGRWVRGWGGVTQGVWPRDRVPPSHRSGQQTPGRATGSACTGEQACTRAHLQPRVGRCLKHPSSSQFVPVLHLGPQGWAGCEIKLQRRLRAVCRGSF